MFRALVDALVEEGYGDELPAVEPAAVTNCVDFLRNYGLNVEGLFREPAPDHVVHELSRWKEGTVFPLDSLDFRERVHGCSNVILNFFVEMPVPLFTSAVQDKFSSVASSSSRPSVSIFALHQVVSFARLEGSDSETANSRFACFQELLLLLRQVSCFRSSMLKEFELKPCTLIAILIFK